MNIIEFISQPWHWSISGLAIAFVMYLLIYFGQKFGVSSSFQAMCSIGGAGSYFDYFDYDWKKHDWLLVFAIGGILGGAIGSSLLTSPEPLQLSQATINDLAALGISSPDMQNDPLGFLPKEIFSFESLTSLRGVVVILLGGFMIGFGTRWAGGCTSGHAITGLSNLQLPSLIAVIGFFIGGLTMTHLLFPIIFSN